MMDAAASGIPEPLPPHADGVAAADLPEGATHHPINWPVLETFLDTLPKRLEARLHAAWGMRAHIARQPAVPGSSRHLLAAAQGAGLTGLVKDGSSEERGVAWFSPLLVSAFVEFALGNRSGATPEAGSRDITPFDRSVFRPFLRHVLEAVTEAVAPAGALPLALEHWGVAEEAGDCPALKLPVTIGFSGIRGDALLVIPLRFLAPLDDALNGIFHGVACRDADDWQRRLNRQMLLAEVTLSAVLHRQTMPLGTVQRLTVGETLVFDAPAEPEITLAAAGVAVAKGKLGRAGARIAVRLETAIFTRKDPEQ